jgi:hypothetical protein
MGRPARLSDTSRAFIIHKRGGGQGPHLTSPPPGQATPAALPAGCGERGAMAQGVHHQGGTAPGGRGLVLVTRHAAMAEGVW